MFVLEPLERARARGARVLAEVCGYGTTCDAYHRVRLDDSGEEPARAMREALADAGLSPRTSATCSTTARPRQLNDRIETRATKKALGDAAAGIAGSVKSQIGHPQGASGAAGSPPTLLGMQGGFLPPTLNLETPDPECDLDYVPNAARPAQVEFALCNGIAFGSKNSALVLRNGRSSLRPGPMSFWVPRRRPGAPRRRRRLGERGRGEPRRHRVGPPQARRPRSRPAPPPAPSRRWPGGRRASGSRSRLAARARGPCRGGRRIGAAPPRLGLDRKISHARLAARGTAVAADTFRLPSGDRSVDVVLSTLFLHHFAPGEVGGSLSPSPAASPRCPSSRWTSRATASRSPRSPSSARSSFRSRLSVARREDLGPSGLHARRDRRSRRTALPGARVTRISRFVWELVWKRA